MQKRAVTSFEVTSTTIKLAAFDEPDVLCEHYYYALLLKAICASEGKVLADAKG